MNLAHGKDTFRIIWYMAGTYNQLSLAGQTQANTRPEVPEPFICLGQKEQEALEARQQVPPGATRSGRKSRKTPTGHRGRRHRRAHNKIWPYICPGLPKDRLTIVA